MITYNRSAFGLNLIFRIHGSAVYRAVIPSLIAVGIFVVIRRFTTENAMMGEDLGHPYAIGVLVASTTFLIVFRANQGYSRYWEAASATHHMMSKWMDATVHTAVYHMQCDHYEALKPPSYYNYPELNALNLTRERERGYQSLDDDSEHYSTERSLGSGSNHGVLPNKLQRAKNKERKEQVTRRSVAKSINFVEDKKKRENAVTSLKKTKKNSNSVSFSRLSSALPLSETAPLIGRPKLDGNWAPLFNDGKSTFLNPSEPDVIDSKGFASSQGGRTPPLFLQELAHLSSLLVAVALSTLRNDIDGAESPLDIYHPGSPWPEVDPDKDELVKTYDVWGLLKTLTLFAGFARSPEERTRYNASRPLPVIGGVSDNEIKFLQMARGPYAKTQLCWNWLSEFCIREHLAGSLGKVGPPIISRIIQFLGDGMIYYNHARKIMFIPFPFVHAQLSVLFVIVMVPAIPFLMDQYTDDIWLGSILTFFTVLCLSGIHEVARELENPFRNVPNELPLVTLQAQFNEALITMYAGFHPDHYWDGDRAIRKRGGIKSPTSSRTSSPEPGAPPESAASSSSSSNGIGNNSNSSITSSTCGSTSSSDSSSSLSSSSSAEEEIRILRKQLESQQKLIERLAAKVNMDPIEETKQLETVLEDVSSEFTPSETTTTTPTKKKKKS